MKIEMGIWAEDEVTRFQGRVIAVAKYLTGCTQILLQPTVKDNGDFVESRWIDEDRLIAEDGQNPLKLPLTNNGADKPAPRR